MLNLRSENYMLDLICDGIKSKEWWIFVTNNMNLLDAMEEVFYVPGTQASADCELDDTYNGISWNGPPIATAIAISTIAISNRLYDYTINKKVILQRHNYFVCKDCNFETASRDGYNHHRVSRHPGKQGYPDKNGHLSEDDLERKQQQQQKQTVEETQGVNS